LRRLPLILATAAAVLSGCDRASHFNCKIVVQVETPSGVRTGDGVIRLTAAKHRALLPEEAKALSEITGEAIPVELPGGTTIYALLRSEASGRALEADLLRSLDPEYAAGRVNFVQSVARAEQGLVGTSQSELPAGELPLLVTFTVPSDPMSVRIVNPSHDPIGISKARVLISVTSESVNERIVDQLPWLRGLNAALDGSSITTSNTPSNFLGKRDFKR
jgi:hypothetical protein